MKRLWEQRVKSRFNVFMILGLCLICYFSYHLVFSERSLISLMSLESKEAVLEQEYAMTIEEKHALEKKVVRLRPSSVDGDLLEERMAHMLGFYNNDAMVVIEHPNHL